MKFLDSISSFLIEMDSKYSVYFENGLINSLAYCCITIILSFIIYRSIKYFINKKDPDNRKVIVMIWRIFMITLTAYTCMTQFKPVQSLTTTLLASGGVLALVISLAAQESVGNLIAGIVIIMFKPFCIGDLIKINNGEYIGYVEEITLRHTIIRTYEHNRITIPNSIINKSSIENADLIDTKKVNFLEITISYDSNIDDAIRIIKEESQKHKYCIDMRSKEEKRKKVPKVPVRLVEFEDSGIRLRAYIYSEDSSKGFEMLSDLRYSIKKRFDETGIEIPYPYRMLIIKQETSEN